MEEEKKYQMKDSTYYSRIVMMIVNSIQLILFIVFIVFTHTIRDDMREVNKSVGYSRIEYDFVFDEQTQGIDTCFAFFIISFVFFLFEFIWDFACKDCDYQYDIFKNIFGDWNHLIIILTFLIAQFLYLISCLIIPIYLDRVRTLRDHLEDNYFGKTDIYDNVIFSKDDLDKVESCIGKYACCVVIAYVFLVIFIFLYFIILNLYKGACCDMFTICKKTNDCFNNFGGCMRDNVYCIFNCGKVKDPVIEELKREINERKKTIEKITCNIQNGLKNNIKLRVDNIEYL